MGWVKGLARTGIHLAAEAEDRLANAGAHDGAVLRLVADHLVLALFDVVPLRLSPGGGEGREGLELVAFGDVSILPLQPETMDISPQYDMMSPRGFCRPCWFLVLCL